MRLFKNCLVVLVLCCSSTLAERLYVNDKRFPESKQDLVAIQDALVDHLGKARSATVCIKLNQGSGSGVIVSPDGLVLTAAHVVAGVNKKLTVIMEDGTEYEAKSLGLNADNDAAMLQILDQTDLPFVDIEPKNDSKKPEIQLGDWVFSLGHAGGFDAERGSVVRLGRMVRVAKSTVQSDCKLIGGDSGGPLFDMNGTLVGIHSRVGRVLEQNMHVPIQVFHTYWSQLSAGEFIGSGPFAEKPVPGSGFMGMAVKETASGLEVTQLEPRYPAHIAGIEVGDVILKIDGDEFRLSSELREFMEQSSAGDLVIITYTRDGEEVEEELTLAKR
ncbi:S1C family serine protease [Rubritalea sp.]|uniref:S1C family serine protease n=1 Tax=Rubritalea sp. TaxID=2109375 RepID=UPI003EF42119